MTIFRGTLIDVPENPFAVDPTQAVPTQAVPTPTLRVEDDGGLLVDDERIVARGSYAEVRQRYPNDAVVDLRPGVVLPGFVDTHVHYPQVRAIGGLGMPLLDWLRECALPEEARLADRAYAEQVAEEFLTGLLRAGTTTALVFGSHFVDAMDALFAAAASRGLRITAGQVLSDRVLRPDLLTTPECALTDGQALIRRWHGHDRLRYAVTPRFALSTTEAMLDVCAELLANDGVYLTSHVNENGAEIDQVRTYFPQRRHYVDTYAHHGLIGPRTVLAHNVHPTDHELDILAGTHAWVSHCPTSNAALGSGLFPLRRHVQRGVGVALGSDVGGGTGFSLLKEGLQAYFAQQLLGPDGLPLAPVHLLYLATRAGAAALGLADQVGDLSVGRQFDAIWLRPEPGGPLAVNLAHADSGEAALARVFALGTPADVAGVWIGGRRLLERPERHFSGRIGS